MKQAIYVPILLMGVLCASGSSHADMYKWTDKTGETHYTATPPPADAEGKDIEDDIRLSTGKLGNAPAAVSAPTDEMEQAREAGKKSEEQHRDFCKQQSAALKQMTANSLIKWKDTEGERFLTAEEKFKKMKELKKNLDSMCKPEMFGNTPERQTSQTETAFDNSDSPDKSGVSASGSGQGSGSAGNTGATGSSAADGTDQSTLSDGTNLPATD